MRWAAAHIPLDDPLVVAKMLYNLQDAGAEEQTAALLHRDPANRVALDDPAAVASLLRSLRETGAEQQTAALADRLPGAGMFELFLEQGGRQDRFRFGREADGSPAESWSWEDLD